MSIILRLVKLKIPNKYWFLFFLILNFIKPLENSCPNNIYLTNINCFNNIITFPKNFRAGQFATNKNGDMIIEYSNDNKDKVYQRLFFGLKKNGRGFSLMKILIEKEMSNILILPLDMVDTNQEICLFV